MAKLPINSPEFIAKAKATRLSRPPVPSLRKAINDFCKWCIHDPESGLGAWREQVEGCTATDCPLYSVRPLSKRRK